MSDRTASDHPALRTRAALDALTPYSAGRDANALRRDSGFGGNVIKLASNEGAEGPVPAARIALEANAAAVQRYPDAYAAPLVTQLAQFHGVAADQVMVANGGCALIAHLSSALLEAGDEVVLGKPTFHLYRLEGIRMGAMPVEMPVKASGEYDLASMARAIGPRTRIVYVCTPNNPTGGLVSRVELTAFLEALPPRVLPVIDEAYFEYVDHPDYPQPLRFAPICERPAVFIRTFSKIYGLAGLRIGYAIAPAALIASCRKIQNPYEVNRHAQAAALASLTHSAEIDARRTRNSAARDHLAAGLRALGLKPLASHGNFICVAVGHARSTAAALESLGVIVRPLDAMGDRAAIRITVGTLSEIDAALLALAAIQQ
jgi:histidinol-phosphate aminotransferase